MIVLGYVLLALALFATVLYIPIAATIRPVSGPDSMGLITLVFLTTARWLVLLVAITVAATHHGFPWIAMSRGAQWISVVLLLGLSGALEVWSIVGATSWYGRNGRLLVGLFTVVCPFVLILLTGAALDQGRLLALGDGTLRATAGVLLLIMAAGAVLLGMKNVAAARETRAYRIEREAEETRVLDEKWAAFRTLTPDRALEDWLVYTEDAVDEIRDAAVASIRARPRLTDELVAILQGDDPLPALRWLWLWSPERPAALARPVYEAASGLPEWARKRYEDDDRLNDTDVATACEAMVVVAESFHGPELDFNVPFERMRAFLDARALPEERMGEDVTYQPRSMMAYWFDRHGRTQGGGSP